MPSPLLVETVLTEDIRAMRARRDGVSDADLIELRLDALARPDVAAALAGRQKPVVVTCRPTWEGGLFDGAEADRVAILEQALAQGAEFVDVEWRAQDAHRLLNDRTRSRIVVSMHDFAGMPGGLASDVEQMRRLGPAVVKVAVTPSRLGDLVPLLEIGRRATDRTVLIAMGVAGLPTRALPAHFGSCWTYAGNGYAPGQIAADRLLSEFRLRQVDARTPVYAVVGRPIGHSVSPAMHNAAFEAHDAAGVYVPCEAESFDDFLGLAEALPIVGVSVTAPFKEDAAAVADGGLESAVNTLRRRADGGWEGLNTDVDGFLAPLGDIDLRGARVSVLGAGGAARSVVAGLRRKGARIRVHARRSDAGAALAEELDLERGPWPVPSGVWDVLVNTTPVGTHPDVDASPMAGCALDGRLVYDLVYNPRPTRLLRDAAVAGCRTIDGLDMLVQQAVRQFAWWTGVMPSSSIMRAAAERRLAEMERRSFPTSSKAPGSPR